MQTPAAIRSEQRRRFAGGVGLSSFQLIPGPHHPGMQGGRYTADNVQLVCNVCQCVKHWHPQKQARRMVQRLLRAPLKFGDDGPLERPPVTLDRTVHLRQTALERAKCLHESILRGRNAALEANEEGACKKVKEVTVTVQDLAELILGSTTANGDVVDATGLAWPWEMLSPDRIDADQGYVKGSIRLLLKGSNSSGAHVRVTCFSSSGTRLDSSFYSCPALSILLPSHSSNRPIMYLSVVFLLLLFIVPALKCIHLLLRTTIVYMLGRLDRSPHSPTRYNSYIGTVMRLRLIDNSPIHKQLIIFCYEYLHDWR